MPRLLQIDSCLGVLSTGRISEGIAKIALEQGWECFIAHGARYVGNTIQTAYQIETRLGEYFHFAKSFLFDAHGLGSVKATKALIQYVKTIKPDVIQLHCIHGYYLNYKLLFEYLSYAKIPVVWTQHDSWAFSGHCSYSGFANCEKWKSECFNCPLRNRYPRSLIDMSRRNYRLKRQLFTSVGNLTIVSVSRWLDSVVGESFLKRYPRSVIYNGIDTTVFRRYTESVKKKHNIEKSHFLLAVSSAWSEEKGLNDYINLSALLPDDYCIVLVGVNDSLRHRLPKQIVSIPRTDSKQELAALYSNADFVTSLSYCETMGLTVAEGMACGTPAIVYDNTAQPELITPEVGYVVKTGDYVRIIDIVKNSTLQGEGNLIRTRAACIDRAKNHFSADRQYEKYLDLYNSLV